MVKIFSSDLSKCRKVKFLYGVLLSISAFIMFIVFPLMWFFRAPVKKAPIDYLNEYVYARMNYQPYTIKQAFFNPLEYQFPLYSTSVEPRLQYDLQNNIYQIFKIQSSFYVPQKSQYVVVGNLTRISCDIYNNCNSHYNGSAKLFIKIIPIGQGFQFVLERVVRITH